MTKVHPRRSERIALRRHVHLVFRNIRGHVDSIPAATYSVNCHGAGVYANRDYPLGTEVFVMDSQSGMGAWGKLVWEGDQLRDGRWPLGVEFISPANYWRTRLVPPSWLPYVCGKSGERMFMHPDSDKVVLVGRQKNRPKVVRDASPTDACRCCGSVEEVSITGDAEPLCRVCREWESG